MSCIQEEVWREKNKCRSIYKFSALDFVATEAKKNGCKGKKDVRHPWNFAGAWNLISRAEQPCPPALLLPVVDFARSIMNGLVLGTEQNFYWITITNRTNNNSNNSWHTSSTRACLFRSSLRMTVTSHWSNYTHPLPPPPPAIPY